MVDLGQPRDGERPTRSRHVLGLAPGWTWNDLTDRFRWLRPGVLALAVACFALPFLTVSCEAPTWGPAVHGETTIYSGFDLAFGGVPDRGRGDAGRPGSDVLRAFPLTVVALVLIVAALVISTAALAVRLRRGVERGPTGYRSLRRAATVVTALALVVHLLAGAVASRSLAATVNTALGRPVDDPVGAGYVHTGQGFVLVTAALVLPLLVGAVNTWSQWQARRERVKARRRSRGRNHSGVEIRSHHPPTDGTRRVGSTWSDATPRSPRTPREPSDRRRR